MGQLEHNRKSRLEEDEYYMGLALEMAASARGKTNPNPMVGAILVKEGVIVGSGIHRKAGEPHAEVHAFRMAGEHAQGATLYVTLEPCSHYGKTPPCAELVSSSGISRMVVAMQDPNPQVAGKGIQMVTDAGIEVEVGILEQEALRLNERFIHNMLTQTPYIIAKTAMTLDGKIATASGQSKWITGEEARRSVHHLRHEIDAICVGIGTVLADNPALTTRLPNGGKNPIRIILDSSLRTPVDANVTDCSEAETWIVAGPQAALDKQVQLEAKGVHVIRIPGEEKGIDLHALMAELYKRGVTDLLLEGGSEVNGAFLRAGLIHKYIVYIAPKVLGGRHSLTPFAGIDVDHMGQAAELTIHSAEMIGQDLCLIAYPLKQ